MAERLHAGPDLPNISLSGLERVLERARKELERSQAPFDPSVITPEDRRTANLDRFRAEQRALLIVGVLEDLWPSRSGESWMNRARPQQPADIKPVQPGQA